MVDRGARHHEPLSSALERLLGLPQSRLGISEVQDLLQVPALRRRFGIDEAQLPQLQAWFTQAGIRWGLDAEHRATLGLPDGSTVKFPIDAFPRYCLLNGVDELAGPRRRQLERPLQRLEALRQERHIEVDTALDTGLDTGSEAGLLA